MKMRYRIKKKVFTTDYNPNIREVVYTVQVMNILGVWTNVKHFHDQKDEDFAKREADELLEKLMED